MKKLLIILVLFLAVQVYPQKTHLDYKVTKIGQVHQLITNMGTLWRAGTDYPGLIYCEFPPGSYIEHVGEGGIWVGAIDESTGDTSVSCTTSWNSGFEFYPTAEPWDSIWVVPKNDTMNIPYWHNYVGVSDQDFVCRYSDDNLLNVASHTPLHVEVIQSSYAWASPPLNQMIVYNFNVIAKKDNLKKVYLAYWLDGNIGHPDAGFVFALDDWSTYYPDRHLMVQLDDGEDCDGTVSPIGIKVFPPKNIPADSIKWTFNWYPGQGMGAPPSDDVLRYKQMASGQIMQDQQDHIGSQGMIAFGPFNLDAGDTLHFQIGEILGYGLDGELANAKTLNWLVDQDFKVPSPPPVPPLKVKTMNHEIILDWTPQPGDVNPETYTDPYRGDSIKNPFEGYRVYKSTQSASGPWTLLGEYDVVNDGYGNETGLTHQYVDKGLLNNFDYYYSVTAFSKKDTSINFPSQESSVFSNAKTVVPGTAPPKTVGEVAVVPNPYRGDIAYYSYNPPWEKPQGTRETWMEQDRRIQFINLPEHCEIKIYSLAGDFIYSIEHNNAEKGYEDWNMTSHVGQAVSSGIYLYTVQDLTNGKVQVGKFVIIK